jgi:hypothetical protein
MSFSRQSQEHIIVHKDKVSKACTCKPLNSEAAKACFFGCCRKRSSVPFTHFGVNVPSGEKVFDGFSSSVNLDTPVEAREDMKCDEEEEKKPHQLEEVFGHSK